MHSTHSMHRTRGCHAHDCNRVVDEARVVSKGPDVLEKRARCQCLLVSPAEDAADSGGELRSPWQRRRPAGEELRARREAERPAGDGDTAAANRTVVPRVLGDGRKEAAVDDLKAAVLP